MELTTSVGLMQLWIMEALLSLLKSNECKIFRARKLNCVPQPFYKWKETKKWNLVWLTREFPNVPKLYSQQVEACL